MRLILKAVDASHPDPDKDRKGCYKRGMVIGAEEDSYIPGASMTLPKMAIIDVPLVPKAKGLKYLAEQLAGDGSAYRRRLWKLRWADLPAAARNKLATTGRLVIKATAAYTGAYDYTWAQVKAYFQNLETGLNETEDL